MQYIEKTDHQFLLKMYKLLAIPRNYFHMGQMLTVTMDDLVFKKATTLLHAVLLKMNSFGDICSRGRS